MTARTNGDGGPVIDLNKILGDRAKVRHVKLGGRSYRFGPLSLVTARLLQQGDIDAALRSLLVDPDKDFDAFIAAVPAADIDKAIRAIYGEVVLGEAKPRPRGSAQKKGASKPSKRTSRSAGSPSPSS